MDLEKLVEEFCENWWKEKLGLKKMGFVKTSSGVPGKIFVDLGAIKTRSENFDFTQIGDTRSKISSIKKKWTNNSGEAIKVDTKVCQSKEISIRCEQKEGMKMGGKNELKLNFQLPAKIGSIGLDVSATFENTSENIYESKTASSSSTEDTIHFDVKKKTSAEIVVETKEEAVYGEFECTVVLSGMARFGLRQSNGQFDQGSALIGEILNKAVLDSSWVHPKLSLALKNIESARSYDAGRSFAYRVSGQMEVKSILSSSVFFNELAVEEGNTPELKETVKEMQIETKKLKDSERILKEVMEFITKIGEEELPAALKKFVTK
uniref:Uncharacterized protein n=1 Tax=Ditylenchus dipsaci TaxID=166011 RepID=A0A915DGN5_9BILA